MGLDDIDSPRGGCTTHFASLLIENLSKWGVEWLDYPNLVRLNPNIPFRTRGNGAVALRFKAQRDHTDKILAMVRENLEKYSERGYLNTNPGVVLLVGGIPKAFERLAEIAMWRFLPLKVVKRVLHKYRKHVDFFGMGNKRGLVGATAAVANRLLTDHTFEFIAYRAVRDCHKKRGIDKESVLKMDNFFGEQTFSNLDPETGTVLIGPHGPDPVLFGIRGEQPEDVLRAGQFIRAKQRIVRWTIFRTNQGTGQHLTHKVRIECLRPYMAAVVRGVVDITPKYIEGGHVIFRLKDETDAIDCAVYEPTGKFREVIMELIKGDAVEVYAGVRPASRTHGITLNIEGLEILQLANKSAILNPICPNCKKRMKSAGKDKGFKCAHCGHKERVAQKIVKIEQREIKEGVYLPPLRAQRHLTRPFSRWHKQNRGIPRQLIKMWDVIEKDSDY